jgi:hypothetical protein
VQCSHSAERDTCARKTSENRCPGLRLLPTGFGLGSDGRCKRLASWLEGSIPYVGTEDKMKLKQTPLSGLKENL